MVVVVDPLGQPTRLLLIRHGNHDPRGGFVQHAGARLTKTGVVVGEGACGKVGEE